MRLAQEWLDRNRSAGLFSACSCDRCAGARVVLQLAAQLAEANERTVSISFPNHQLSGGVEREYTLDDIEPLLERAEQAEAAAASARETALKVVNNLTWITFHGESMVQAEANRQTVLAALGGTLQSTPAPVTPSAPAEVDGWRFDMENAPKDGTTVDLWCSGEFPQRWTDCAWRKPHHECLSEYCDSCPDDLSVNAWRCDVFDQRVPDPIAWRPLPSPPTALEGA